MADRISPLNDLAMPRTADGDAAVNLSERMCTALVQVQAWPDTIEQTAKVIEALKGDLQIMRTGPGRWLIEGEGQDLEARLRKKINSKTGAVTGLTHGRVVVSIEGEKATWVLASGIALDFSKKAFPVGETRLSHFHEIGLTIHRLGDNDFDLYVFTSLARSFWQWLETASAEVGYSVG